MLLELLSLPNEILSDILLRLPLKNLVICACVSKTLNNFITNPEFIKAHYQKRKDKPLILLGYHIYRSRSFKEQFRFYPDNETSFVSNWDVKSIEVPKKDGIHKCFNIIGCCNGVICLYDQQELSNYCIMLWNPSIRKFIELPCPNVNPQSGVARAYLGFGCDRLTNDLKVVRLVYHYIDSQPYPSELPPTVEVYTVSSGSWRNIRGSGPMHKTCGRKTGFFSQGPHGHCFLDGASYWVGYKQRGRDAVWSAIVTFDMHAECFGEMKLPACIEGCDIWRDNLMLTPCKDTLALIRTPCKSGQFCIWVMKDYGNAESWMELYKFDLLNFDPRPTALYFRKNKEILMLEGRCGFQTMFSANYDRNNKKKLRRFHGPMEGNYLATYEEGLALFKEGKSYLK